MPHALTRTPMTSSSTNQFGLDRPKNHTQIQTTCKKKKKKKGRENALTKLDLWLWLKSQNFQNRPVLLGFLSTFQFWDPFLHSKLGNYASIRFLESWLLHKSWPKVKIFKKDLSCSIFRIHSNFGVCSVIWDSKIAQMAQYQHSWLLCWKWPKFKIFKPDLSCSVFRNLEITNLTHISEVLMVSKNLSSQDQNLRFIHLVWIPSGLSSRLHQGFPFKEQMNSHKCVLNLKLHWVATSAYHSRLVPNSLPPTILIRCLPFSPKILICNSHLTCPSTILHLSAINRRLRFIEAHLEKHTESWNENLLLSKSQILLLINISCHRLIILNT